MSVPAGNISRISAKALAVAISKLVAFLVVWYKVRFEVDLTSKLPKSKEVDLISVTREL